MIIFDAEAHTYTDTIGRNYESVTRFINRFVPQFDFEDKSKKYASKYGMDVEEVRKDWKSKNKSSTDFGTKVHSLIEEAIRDNVLVPGDFFNIVKSMYDEVQLSYKGKYLTETIVYNTEYQIAGMSDLIIDNENSFSLIDFKTNKQIKYTNDFEDKNLLKPIKHLPNSEYFKYSLQLSFYAYFYSLQTGKQLDRLAFYWLKRKNAKDYTSLSDCSWVRYNAPYLKEEVIQCLNYV